VNWLNHFWHLLFPVSCLSCKKKGIRLCFDCLAKIPPPKSEIAGIISLFDYRNEIIKKAIWLIKYKGQAAELIPILAQAAFDRVLPTLEELKTFENFENPILIPVPLSAKREKERGYNQASLLAKELAKLLHLPLLPVVKKIKETPTQVSRQSRTERLQNLKGCFLVSAPEKVKGKNILIVDDVTTTGATIGEVKRILLAAGAKKVRGLTVAH